MTRGVLSPEAQRDSDEILSSLARHAGSATAGRFARNFDEVFAVLADHPETFPARHTSGIGIRMGVVPPYIVFHEHDTASAIVRILRIVHGRRRITRRLLRGSGIPPQRSS